MLLWIHYLKWFKNKLTYWLIQNIKVKSQSIHWQYCLQWTQVLILVKYWHLEKVQTLASRIVIILVLKITKIVADFQVNRANLYSYHNVNIENLHSSIEFPSLKKLITEVFDTSVFPIIDAFQVLSPTNIPINLYQDEQ